MLFQPQLDPMSPFRTDCVKTPKREIAPSIFRNLRAREWRDSDTGYKQ